MEATAAARSPLTVVTGASSGIGRELALLAARDGHAVLLVARGKAALERVAEEVRAAGSPDVQVHVADLSDTEQVEATAARALAAGRPVATLVNNAGYGVWGPLREQDPAELAGMVDLNARAVVLLTRLLLPSLQEAGGGVLTVASTAAFQPGPGMAVYHASKSFVLFFSLALREELRRSGVRVTALCPGPVPTGFQARSGVGDMTDMRMARLAEQPADRVARIGWRGLRRGRAVVIPGLVNRTGAAAARMSPLRMATRVTRSALGAIDRDGNSIRRP